MLLSEPGKEVSLCTGLISVTAKMVTVQRVNDSGIPISKRDICINSPTSAQGPGARILCFVCVCGGGGGSGVCVMCVGTYASEHMQRSVDFSVSLSTFMWGSRGELTR